MKRVCVFCGSHPGATPAYAEEARRLGRAFVERNLTLVYGGASVGLMGEIADTVLEAGGEVIGVIPTYLFEKEVAHTGLSDLRVVDSMHQRKALMAELADAFIALPGGIGTLEEFFEVWTWAQLGMHDKLCGLLNVGNYYHHLIQFMDQMVAQGFLKPAHRANVVIEDDANVMLDRLQQSRATQAERRIDLSGT
jgi:uncharacterized protein (TIGR00730 family)